MEMYLIRHGEADRARAIDPYTVPLTPLGEIQARRVARQCQEWGIRLLYVSTMLPAQQTADAVTELMPQLARWDLEELEDFNIDDLLGEPTAGQLVSTWTEAQLSFGYERASIRVMSALTRIQLYAVSRRIGSIGIIAHGSTLQLLLLNWLGLDWRSAKSLDLSVDCGATCKVSLDGYRHVRIAWINRL